MNLKKSKFLGYEIFNDDFINLVEFLNQDHKTLISCLNPHSLVIADQVPEFNEALKNSTILLCDGVGISLFSGVSRTRGEDIFRFVLQNAALLNLNKVMFVGSNNDTLLKIQEKISSDFPKLKVGIYSPVFTNSYFVKDDGIYEAIDKFSPDVVFFGLSAPKQEILSYKNFDRIRSKLIVNIGAVFDYYSGNIASPPKYIIRMGLEWLYRLYKQPQKIGPRVFISTLLYLKIVFKSFIKNINC
jgi:N-acetylglucosaminyldiphosphoundecaprenol N-acetyl-beta-D-mannosaminyltransferase